MAQMSPHSNSLERDSGLPTWLGLTLILMSACSDVVSEPIVRSAATGGFGGATAVGSTTSGSTQGGTAATSLIMLNGVVPESHHCATVSSWSWSDTVDEDGFLNSLNTIRTGGGVCGSVASGSLERLTMSPELRCSARLHSLDMVTTGYTGQLDWSGSGPVDRMALAGYSAWYGGEVIAAAPPGTEPFSVLGSVLSVGGIDCLNLLNPAYVDVGVGLNQGLWTIDLGTPE